MTKLSVNVNKLATIRNSRGGNNPDVVKTSLALVEMGAEGITVHPRPDERHIRRSDVYLLKKAIKTVEFNIEGFPAGDFMQMVEEVQPEQCTLVPDPPEALTSNAGWNISANRELLSGVAKRLRAKGVRSSVFIDPLSTSEMDYKTLKEIGIDRVELYTERYAVTYGSSKSLTVLADYVRAAELAQANGLGVNAGHDLSLENLEAFIRAIPSIDEVSIGHALICDALFLGFEQTIERYLACISRGHKAAHRK